MEISLEKKLLDAVRNKEINETTYEIISEIESRRAAAVAEFKKEHEQRHKQHEQNLREFYRFHVNTVIAFFIGMGGIFMAAIGIILAIIFK